MRESRERLALRILLRGQEDYFADTQIPIQKTLLLRSTRRTQRITRYDEREKSGAFGAPGIFLRDPSVFHARLCTNAGGSFFHIKHTWYCKLQLTITTKNIV